MSGEFFECGGHTLDCECQEWMNASFGTPKNISKCHVCGARWNMGDNQWICVEDRLPELYDYVLVFADNQGTNEPKPISIARMYNEEKWEFIAQSPCMPNYGAYMDIEYDIDSDNITHWMPLPSLPKK